MATWKNILRDSITTSEDLSKHLGYEIPLLDKVITQYPLRINPYFLKLIKQKGDSIWKQCIPDPAELNDTVCHNDPLAEDKLSPIPQLVHKYPDRVLLLVHNQCAVYCRFCTRKRMVGTPRMCISRKSLNDCYKYIRNHPEIKEVLLSGGDPLLLEDDRLGDILSQLKQIPTIEIIRIGSRVPSTLPMRITPRLVDILRQHGPIYLNTHFNHPDEITPETQKACGILADNGIVLGCQTVLLKGVNDSPEILKSLFRELLQLRVRPYYLFQADLTRGTDHLRTHSQTGIAIMQKLYGHISGMAIPTFAIDAPGGKGKIPLTPQYILQHGDDLVFENYRGEICTYPEAGEPI